MPRKPRFFIENIPVHIVQRGHSKNPIFFEDSDYGAYLGWLKEAAERYECELHAYVLMTNHIHILTTPQSRDSISRMMQYIGRYYVPYINHAYGTSGSIWEGRYKASLVQEDRYLLSCMRYIELNPVRANMVKSPGQYRWSSYKANALGEKNSLITPRQEYKELGRTVAARCEHYRALFKTEVEEKLLTDIRNAWQTGTPLGSDLFKRKIEHKLKLKVGQTRRGRPNKPKKTEV